MNPKTASPLILPESYPLLLQDIKTRIRESQVKAALAANQELIRLFLEKLCKDLQSDFPRLGGFSRTNLFRMRSFYLSYAIVPQLVGQLAIPLSYARAYSGGITKLGSNLLNSGIAIACDFYFQWLSGGRSIHFQQILNSVVPIFSILTLPDVQPKYY